MPLLRPFLSLRALLLVSLSAPVMMSAQEAPVTDAPPAASMQATRAPQEQIPAPIAREAPQALRSYNKAIFEKPFDFTPFAYLKTFEGARSDELFHDKQFRKLMKALVPDCMFHYGRDMSLAGSVDMVISGSRDPVRLREGRYLMLSGELGPYLGGRAFLWIDLQDGVGVGAFYFHPTNGEPTPTVAVFSRQIRTELLALSDLPPAFAQDLGEWSVHSSVPEVTTRYFLTGTNKRVLLEHDEDFCSLGDGRFAPSGSGCEQLNADAADVDETAAYYLAQVHYATNATAWMIGSDQIAWVQLRSNTCSGIADPLGCRIRVTREHTHAIIHRPQPRSPVRR